MTTMSQIAYQVRFAHTTQRTTYATRDEALAAVETVIPGADIESYDAGVQGPDGESCCGELVLAWVDAASKAADLDGSRAAASIRTVHS